MEHVRRVAGARRYHGLSAPLVCAAAVVENRVHAFTTRDAAAVVDLDIERCPRRPGPGPGRAMAVSAASSTLRA